MKFVIEKFNACKESIVFRKNYSDFKTAWENCPRGDWMLWIAKKLNVDLLKLTTIDINKKLDIIIINEKNCMNLKIKTE